MARPAKMRVDKSELHEQDATFPWRIGDIVEMKSNESGYRGAWFRVEIKKVRRGRNGKLYSTVIYKDFPDESEEEVVAIDVDPVTKEKVLMIRPVPPPAIKESEEVESEELNSMHAVFRDYWEAGDQVDWWYHDCWWLAEVVSVLGDGRFQLKCPSPPSGEGGVYMAKECDMRASLNWSLEEQWSIPPSKEPEMKPCVRFVGPAFRQEVVRDISLEPEEIIKEQDEVLRKDVQKQKLKKKLPKSEKKNENVAVRGMSTPKSKRKRLLTGEEQSKIRQLDSFENLEDQSQEEQKACHRQRYMTVDLDDSLHERDPEEHSQRSEQVPPETEEALNVMGDEDSLSYKMTTGAGSSGHQPETQPDPEGECALKINRSRGRPRKDSLPRGRGRPPKHSNTETHEVPAKKPSTKPRANQEVITEEALELRDAKPSKSSKVRSEKCSQEKAKLLPDIEVEDVHQIKVCEDFSMGHMEAEVEGAPEIGVLFDVGLGDMEKSIRSLRDEKKKRKRGKRDLIEENRSVDKKGKGSRRGSENANRMEQEQRGCKSGGEGYESNVGIEEKAKTELHESFQKMKRRPSKLEAAQQLDSDNNPEDKTPVYDQAPVNTPFHEVQKVKDNVYPRVSDTETHSKQSGADEIDRGQREQQEIVIVSAKKAQGGKTPTRKDKMPKKITSVKIALEKKSEAHVPDHDRVQEPLPVSSRPGGASDSEGGLPHEDNPVLDRGMKAFPDMHSSKSTWMPANPPHDAEDYDNFATSNDPDIFICDSLGSLSDGVCSGVLRGDDLDDDIISAVGLEADADSCSLKFSSSRSRPLENCAPGPDHSKGRSMNPDSSHRLLGYSPLKTIVNKPLIKYKTVLGRKLVRHAKRKFWAKGKPISNPRTS